MASHLSAKKLSKTFTPPVFSTSNPQSIPIPDYDTGMTSSKTFNQIKKDKTFLLKSYLGDFLLTSSLIGSMLMFKKSEAFSISLTHMMLLPFAIIFGFMIASFLHNTCHQNVPTTKLNRIVGEFCGVWVLYGFSNFIMIHFLHHQNSDEDLDPVNPNGMTFLVFLSAPMRYMIKAAKKWLRLQHGHHENYESIMSAQIFLFHANLILKIAFWYVVFGPTLFLAFYVPSLLANYGILAHINFVCHRDLENGEVEIVNLNHNLYYKFANLVTFGGYFHKNHHLKMTMFNPMKLAPNDIGFTIKHGYEGSYISRYFNINQIWDEGKKNKITNRKIHNNIFNISATQGFNHITPINRRRA